jgi:hypothetical protein
MKIHRGAKSPHHILNTGTRCRFGSQLHAPVALSPGKKSSICTGQGGEEAPVLVWMWWAKTP